MSRNSAAKARPASSRRPETTMRAPSWANARAVARPMPVRAPVIRTTGTLAGLFMGVFLVGGRCVMRRGETQYVRTYFIRQAKIWMSVFRIFPLGGHGMHMKELHNQTFMRNI